MSFASLSQSAQVARLRITALKALQAYPFEVKRLRLLNHGFNTTFRVDTADGQKFALRLNVNSRRSAQQIRAEMAWLEALSRETDLRVPTPQLTREGALLQHLWNADLGRELPAALFSWLPGKNLGQQATPQQMREVGRATSLLHQHALTWKLPAGAELSSLQDPLMDSPNNFESDNKWLTPEAREVIDLTMQQTKAVLDKLFTQDAPRPLHADLHNWNLKWARGKLYVFDFDDSGIGVPVQDLAIAAYYLRPKKEQEAALLEGYAATAPLPTYTQTEFETLVAGRNLVLLNDVLVNNTANIQAMMPRYLLNSLTKLRHFLDTGEFRHDLPGLLKA